MLFRSHNLQACLARFLCGAFMDDSLLHPDDFRTDLDCGVDYWRHILRFAEDLDDIHFAGNQFQIGVSLLTENFLRRRVDRDDLVSLLV